MALNYFSSNTYLEERDLSRELSVVETSTGAIVYVGSRGRLEPQFFTSDQEWLDYNGSPDPTVSFAPYCARRFMRSSASLWAVRAVGTGYSFGGVFLWKPAATPIALAADTESDPRTGNIDWVAGGSATLDLQNVVYFYADGPGSYSSQLSIEIKSKNLAVPSGLTAVDAGTVTLPAGVVSTGTLGAGTYSYRVSAFNEVGETLACVAFTVVISGSNKSVYIALPAVEFVSGYKIYGRTGGSELLIATVGMTDGYYIDRGTITPAGVVPVAQTFTSQFTVNVYDSTISTSRAVEVFECSLTSQVDGYGQQMEIESRINGQSRFIRCANHAASFISIPTVYSITKTAMASGSSGAAVTNAQIAAAWDNFADVDRYDIRLLINGGYTSSTVQLAMLTLATSRGDAFAILDTPPTQQTMQGALDHRRVTLNTTSNRGALYTPDVLIADEFTGKQLYIPPSGDVAGVFAYTDRTTYPWYAPAGPNRGLVSVEGIRTKYNQNERDELQKGQVNYLFSAPGLGISVWEARTLQATLSAFSFINVRRLVDNIGIAARRSERAFLQEPNDDFTRLQVKTTLERYLEIVKQSRGISNYLVVVDSRNNRPIVTANGLLVVDIIITPILPAEKILIRLNVTRQGVNLEELVANGALN